MKQIDQTEFNQEVFNAFVKQFDLSNVKDDYEVEIQFRDLTFLINLYEDFGSYDYEICETSCQLNSNEIDFEFYNYNNISETIEKHIEYLHEQAYEDSKDEPLTIMNDYKNHM